MDTITRFSDCSITRAETFSDPFAARFGIAMPKTLRAQTTGLSWPEFLDRYCPTAGPIGLRSWTQSGPAVAGMRPYEATLSFGADVRTIRLHAAGPIAALSAVLFDAGFGVEVLAFHQQRTAEGTATFVHCEHEGRRHWAVSISTDATDSALRAIIAATNILTRSGR